MIQRVLVVGCGLAGLAVARGLRKLELHVDAIEIRGDICEPGAGLLLTGNAVQALDRLGLGRAARGAGKLVREIAFSDEQGRELFHLDLDRHANWPEFISIHRSSLQKILLEFDEPVAVRLGLGLAELEPRDTCVRARFSDGETGDYDLVIGADGVRSRVRELVFAGPSPTPIPGYSGWRFVTTCPAGLSRAVYMLGNGRTMLLHPLAENEVYCGAGPVDACEAGAGSELARLRAAFADFGGPAKVVLENVDERTNVIPTQYWHASRLTWSRGRCVLIGDAAHACAPTLAQGAALAFEDASVLCESLAARGELGTSLRSFEKRRSPRVESVLRESRARMEASRGVDPTRLRLRNQVLRSVGAQQLEAAWAPLMEQRP